MTKLVVFVGFCVAFAAGLTVGMTHERQMQQAAVATPMPTSRPSHRGGTVLPSELNLTQDQQEKLSKIWSETARGNHEDDDRRWQLRQKRDEAIASLIQPGDKGKYERALADFTDQAAALDKAKHDRWKNAVEETKQLLTSEQRTKYEEFLSRHPLGGPGGPSGHERGRDRETTHQSTTRPNNSLG